MKTFHAWVATFFGVGKMPFAPGTWASAAAIPFFYPLIDRWPVHAPVLAAVYFLGVWSCTRYSRQRGEVDPSSAVIDEVLGMGVALFAVPRQWPFILMALVLFRLFDIWKPQPIRKIEKLPGGWGIMTDDLVAGIYARIWIQVGIWAVHWLQ
jgi:phosphatidylglycerophosphatase A